MTRSDWERRAEEWTKRDIHEQRICPTDWIEHWAQQAFIAGARAMNEEAAKAGYAVVRSDEVVSKAQLSRNVAAAIRALIGDEGEEK